MNIATMKYWSILLLVFTFLACQSTGNEVEQKPAAFITIDEPEIEVDYTGVKKQIAVLSNCEWHISGVPQWCIIEKVVANGKEYLDVEVTPNMTEELHEATVILSSVGTTATLSISQRARTEQIDPLQWATFMVNRFTNIKYELQADKVTRKYQITGFEVFVNPSLRRQVFLGNLIDCHADNWKLTDYQDKYTFNQITIACFSGKAEMTLPKPSFEGMNQMVQKVIADSPTQSSKFYFSTPIQYYSYRHLHLLGAGNLGLSLDEMISGNPYSEKEMQKRTGMIYTYSHELFTLNMDYPEKLINEVVSGDKLPDMSYINSVTYGKMSLLLIETDHNSNAVKRIVYGMMQGWSLGDEDLKIRDTFDVWYIYFDNDGTHTFKGDYSLIERCFDEIQAIPLGIIPLHFTTNKLEGHAVGEMNIELELR